MLNDVARDFIALATDSPVPSGRGLLFLPHVLTVSNLLTPRAGTKPAAESRPQHDRISPPSASCLDNAA